MSPLYNVQCLPPKPLVTPWCMWGPMGDVITRAQFELNRFRGWRATVTPIFLFPIIEIMTLQQLAVPCNHTVMSLVVLTLHLVD